MEQKGYYSMLIYVATNLINNKKYIGQTSQTLNGRKNHHIRSALLKRYDTHFHRALVKYGNENFLWEVLEECDDRYSLNKLEIYYIDKFNTYKNGYNMSLGGLGHSNMGGKSHPMFGKHHSDETKKKLRDFNLGKKLSQETKNKIGESSKGRVMPAITRRKISEANKGKPLSEDTKKKISESCSGEKHHLFGKKLPDSWRKNAAMAQSYEWLVTLPDGRRKTIIGLNGFCRDNNLCATSMIRAADGKCKEHRGFVCGRLYKEIIEVISIW